MATILKFPPRPRYKPDQLEQLKRITDMLAEVRRELNADLDRMDARDLERVVPKDYK